MDLPGICLVGCGNIATAHAKRLRGKARLWFQSRRPESAAALSKAVGGEGVFPNLDAALESDRVDAVMITTPPEVHAQQVNQVLAADKVVFVEKPMCLSREEVESISDAVRDRPLMVGENYYYKPSVTLLKSWIESGDIGAVERVKVRKCLTQSSSGWKSEHGSLFEGGIHFVALLNSLFGAPTEIVDATFPNLSTPAERHAIVSLSYGSIQAELEYAWDTPSITKGVFQHSSIEGDAGRIVFESNGIYARMTGRRSRFGFPGLGDLMGAEAMIEDFLQTIRTGKPPISSLDRAREDLETVFQAYELGGVQG